MAQKPNEANSQASLPDAENLWKLVGDDGNSACSSSIADGEVNVNLSS